ncbi:unnamed protein product [Musa acuminata subsp. malaccensis]|uniref:(wild Malaysian banana) hypothetical protein n=1 Tax=Musa acuminata subsp. malaccensis TaxID=214687 RepID=A0A804JEP4_MUSAM|nr:unnamed protein product [Musa acuminata subsp. malaccensis]
MARLPPWVLFLLGSLVALFRVHLGSLRGCVRVSIGQVLLSVRCKDSNINHAQEALCHAKFKFPGRQKIIISGKWGFTKFSRAEYAKWKSENRIIPDGVNAKLLGCHAHLLIVNLERLS